MFPKIVVPQNGWFITENPIKMDDLGGKPTIFGNIHVEFLQFVNLVFLDNSLVLEIFIMIFVVAILITQSCFQKDIGSVLEIWALMPPSKLTVNNGE